jgi:hypothetical protein
MNTPFWFGYASRMMSLALALMMNWWMGSNPQWPARSITHHVLAYSTVTNLAVDGQRFSVTAETVAS